jgi:AcrR family transcriptional regulator
LNVFRVTCRALWTLAEAVNRLLVVAFYLLSAGFVALTLPMWAHVGSADQALQLLSVKLGELLPRFGPERGSADCRTLTDVAAAELTPRARQTRAAIVETALALFRERGFEAATMREIASRAGVSTGNAYYYFGSKEELIQEFYAIGHAEHLAASRVWLAGQTELGARLRGTIRALIDVNAPYHAFAATFYKHAAEPSSPLSPFSRASSPTRDASIALYRDVVDGSSARMSSDVRERLPELLWLYSMGVILYWVHDRSPGCARTYHLIDVTAPVVARLVAATRIPLLRSTVRDIAALIDDLRN